MKSSTTSLLKSTSLLLVECLGNVLSLEVHEDILLNLSLGNYFVPTSTLNAKTQLRVKTAELAHNFCDRPSDPSTPSKTLCMLDLRGYSHLTSHWPSQPVFSLKYILHAVHSTARLV